MTAAGLVTGVDGWFDSHSHLQEHYLTGERGPARVDGDPTADGPGGGDLLAATLERAAGAGVRRVVCVGTGLATSRQALAVAADSAAGRLGDGVPDLWATVGLHPHDASEGTGPVLELLASAAGAAPAGETGGGRLVAVGECGLDYHYDHSARDAQRRAFAEQVAAARQLGLALVVHARDAWADLFDVLAAEGVPERTVLHCFTGGPDEARRCLEAGMFVSFSGIVTFKNAADVRAAAAVCPLDRMLVETDSPFLAPVPHRGKANEPSYVPLVGAALAEIKGVGVAEMAASSSVAAAAAFGI